ncbi:MAG: hypothetical protein HON76_14095 [Candidatus Scalindua sp.]|jgi:hypothetical protein|nr:hypothetical protein [Candidatus Scalindua sp.]MBT5305481.1 hypothetical protein [Candidatus Scalindua sp.]MBT6230365.1 hypothetical protein [Candidatus Scalindua sp.]MBT6563650.1 hypothetical protein [Candidatus Scalindua sp.]MBT7210076.1 hypothetical protein [Candidatus Scalindua sp.]
MKLRNQVILYPLPLVSRSIATKSRTAYIDVLRLYIVPLKEEDDLIYPADNLFLTNGIFVFIISILSIKKGIILFVIIS